MGRLKRFTPEPPHTLVIGPTSLLWVFPGATGKFKDRAEHETPRVLTPCPMCGATLTLTELPPPLKAIQPDRTTHVCHPALGGCNQGFEVES